MSQVANRKLAKDVFDAIENLNKVVKAAVLNGHWLVEIEIPDQMDTHEMRDGRLINIVQLTARVSWPLKADDPVE